MDVDQADPQQQNYRQRTVYKEERIDYDFRVQVPELVTVERINRVNELKIIWRQGIRELEEVFANHINRMEDEFDARCAELDLIRQQLLRNQKFLDQYYIDMQKKLLEKQNRIRQEREDWEREKEEMRG